MVRCGVRNDRERRRKTFQQLENKKASIPTLQGREAREVRGNTPPDLAKNNAFSCS